MYESSDATQSKGGPRSQHHLLKIIFSVRKLEVVFKFASLGVLRHTLFQGQQLSNSNTFTFSSLMALKCCFTNLLWEINIILYSTFVVWSDYPPSVEIICEEGWVTHLLLEAAHEQEREKNKRFHSYIFNKNFLDLLLDGWICEISKGGGDLVIWPCYLFFF